MRGDDLRAGLEALVETWEREGAERGPDDTLYTSGVAAMLRHLLDAHPAPSEPEATVVEEWGVRWPNGAITSCGWFPTISEGFARDAMNPDPRRIPPSTLPEAVVRRTRTTFADQVTDWEEVQ